MPPATRDRPLRILFIDDHVPYPELGVGYPRARALLRALHAMGHAVTLVPLHDTGPGMPPAGLLPDAIDITLGITPAGLGRFLQERAGRHDLLCVSRPDNLRAVLAARPDSWRRVPLLYDAESLWSARSTLQQAIEGSPLTAVQADRLLQQEVELASAANHVMAVNDAEAAVFRQRGCASVTVVNHGFAPSPTPRLWAGRDDILFVGALDDAPSPNVDALQWFVRQVMPLLQAMRPVRLLVCGSAIPGSRCRCSSAWQRPAPAPRRSRRFPEVPMRG